MMPTATITIDAEALERLEGRRREGESLSDTIKRMVPPPFDHEEFARLLQQWPKEMVDAIDDRVQSRQPVHAVHP